MLLTSVELENIKSYKHSIIPFHRGTTAICGLNGSGKTTLVEAIGYALFDSLPYPQAQFVREGEKSGTVTVSFLSSIDDREYRVVRRCGSSAQWFVFDPAIEARVVEQRTDVVDWLHEHLRIEDTMELKVLFSDALGVQQGTFTSDFLAKPSDRKRKFDVLLQVEDYRTAYDKLSDTRAYINDQIHTQELRIAELSSETQRSEDLQASLVLAREQEKAATEQLVSHQDEMARVDQVRSQMEQAQSQLKQQESAIALKESSVQAYRDRKQTLHSQLQEAVEAQVIVTANRDAYQAYQQVEIELQELRPKVIQRDRLFQEESKLKIDLARITSEYEQITSSLQSAQRAQKRVNQLQPLVEKQEELERQIHEAVQAQELCREQMKQIQQYTSDLKKYQDEVEKLKQHILEVLQLEPLASQQPELKAQVEHLQAILTRSAEQSNRLQKIDSEIRALEDVERKETERADKNENNIKKLEDNRAVAEKLPELEAQETQLRDQIAERKANISRHNESRLQSAGGHCPFLKEPCQNIKQRGIESLESYFTDLIERDQEHLEKLEQEMAALTKGVEHARLVQSYMGKMEGYQEAARGAREAMQRALEQIKSLKEEREQILQAARDAEEYRQKLSSLKQDLQKSEDAQNQVYRLPEMRKQQEKLEEQVAETGQRTEEAQKKLAEYQNTASRHSELVNTLEKLGNPREEYTVCKAEADFIEKYIAEAADKETCLAEAQQAQASLAVKMKDYEGINEQVERLNAARAENSAGYDLYRQHERLSAKVAELRVSVEQADKDLQKAEESVAADRLLYEQSRQSFDEQELLTTRARADELRGQIGSVRESIRILKSSIEQMEKDISHAREQMQEMGRIQEERQSLSDLQETLRILRETIKEAGPYVMKALLKRISAEANYIFGEIIGDRSQQLAWEEDYEIIIRRQGIERHFPQLSGGEQMSAALAVRLALLKALTGLDIAFFDEPTQNMDVERRMNLAEQIRRVRGFQQLIVISHDDTFEQGLDSLILLEKHDGETQLVEGSAEELLLPV